MTPAPSFGVSAELPLRAHSSVDHSREHSTVLQSRLPNCTPLRLAPVLPVYQLGIRGSADHSGARSSDRTPQNPLLITANGTVTIEVHLDLLTIEPLPFRPSEFSFSSFDWLPCTETFRVLPRRLDSQF